MPKEHTSVLVVSENAGLRSTIQVTLNTTGFVFGEAESGIEAVQKLARSCYDLVLIGVNKETATGFAICRTLRTALPGVGIVVICPGGGVGDEIRALQAGADDCISFPFRFREAVGRLGAVMRKPNSRTDDTGPVMRAGDLRIDLTRRTCWRSRNQIHLSPREFDLLAALMKHRESPLTHVKLLVAVWGPEVKRDTDDLRSYIKSLRRKIETDPGTPQYILTVPWVGYMFSSGHHPTRRQQAAETA